MKKIMDIFGAIIVAVGCIIFLWAFIELTPAQNSAECDYLKYEYELKGGD